jgi:hypothetical protein
MNKLLLLFTFTICLFPFAFAQQYGWTDISANMPELGGFTDVHFIGYEGWITGGNDKIYYTPDGGATFSIQQLPAGSGITSSVFMKNNQEGYAVTFHGKILHFFNNEWTTLHEPGGVINSVHFPPNSDTGYTCGSNGTVWKFTNTFITDISPPANVSNLQSIYFPVNNSDGKVCGQTTIARYKNESWSNLQFYDCTLNYNSITFVNDTTGWIGGIDGTIIHTSDGIHWLIQTSNTTKTIYDILFLNSLEGWAAGSEVLLHTIDGGTTWTQEIASQTVGKALMGVYFTSPNNGFVVGNNTVLKYGDVSGTGNTIAETIQLDIFPNPAVEVISLQSVAFNRQSAVVQIYDLNGRKRLEKHIAKGQETTEIDVSGLASGVYFCRLISEKYSATQKLIIQK